MTIPRRARGGPGAGLIALAIGLGASGLARAQAAEDATTFLPHTDEGRLYLGGQVNIVFQGHPDFSARYSGPNSLRPQGETATSLLLTLATGLRLHRTNEILFDAEIAGGGGISTALGLAGFTDLDVVRNPSLGADPYVARALFHQIIPLSSTWVKNPRTMLGTLPEVPEHRLEVRLGKFSTIDFFDLNGPASDSHLQFLNWTVDNNGAFDYAADTRGYTYGVLLEYLGPRVEARFGEMMMPTVANGIDFDTDLAHARAENLELTLRALRRPGWAGTVRLTGFVNHARMGRYREAIDGFLSGADCRVGMPCAPDIEAHRQRGRIKYGLGLNLEQELAGAVRAFLRLGWNEGENESFAYTEVDDTFEIGGDVSGALWWRPHDRVGLALVTNGLSDVHRQYLALGGHGFLLGDGALTYGRETILETYYNAHVAYGFFVAGDLQAIDNPGYNEDRGPVLVLAARAHLEF